jgi:hypothetical protein
VSRVGRGGRAARSRTRHETLLPRATAGASATELARVRSHDRSLVTADVPAEPAPQALAFTGGDVNLPLAAGAILVGAGGLTLLAARKREQNA